MASPNIRRSTKRPDPPRDLTAPRFTLVIHRIGLVLSAHVFGFALVALALVRIEGPWPWLAAAAGVTVLGLRVFAMGRLWPLSDQAGLWDHRRWQQAGQLTGLAWCAVLAGTGVLCALKGNEMDRLIAICTLFGATADIGSRAADTSDLAWLHFAILQVPSIGFAWSVGPDRWLMTIVATGYVLAVSSIVYRRVVAGRAESEALRIAREAVLAQEEREAELRSLFDSAMTGIAVRDASANRFIRVNPAFCQLLGTSEAELISEVQLGSHTHSDHQLQQAEQWAAIGRTGEPFRSERRYVTPAGDTVWGRVGVAVATRNLDGRPLRYVATIEDITERKAAEAALKASQDWLRLSLDIGGVGTFRRDYVKGLIYCCPETRRMSGLPDGEEPVAAEEWLKTVLPEDLPRFRKDAAEAHAQRQPTVTFTYRFLHPQRGLRHAETRSRVEYGDDGRALFSVGVIIDVTDRRLAETRLAHLAHHDPLTELPNRSLFRISLDAALERPRDKDRFAVLFLDLDHFKEVNDTLGHGVGDALLQAVTRRLKAICRPSDIVARLGGDEFAIIQDPLAQPSDAAALADRVITVLSEPFQLEDERVTIGSSIGIVVAPDDGVDPDHLLRDADIALYSAKGAGRGCHRFFNPTMVQTIQARRALESDLRRALTSGGLELHYQPLIDIATSRISGFEALLRWQHPERGLTMPDVFIPLAESKGLIVPIGAFVLRQACAQAMLWPTHIRIAVNLSATEFASPMIVKTVADALQASSLAPDRLELEITETTMLQDTQSTMDTLAKLKGLGVSVSIDDFGTGFSSLAYLQRFRFDKIKIDRSFVTPLGTASESLAIVGAVINLATALGMDVTAEGVESEAQLAILSRLGCTEAQGYFFSKPRPAAEIDALIERYSGTAAARGATAMSLGSEPATLPSLRLDGLFGTEVGEGERDLQRHLV